MLLLEFFEDGTELGRRLQLFFFRCGRVRRGGGAGEQGGGDGEEKGRTSLFLRGAEIKTTCLRSRCDLTSII